MVTIAIFVGLILTMVVKVAVVFLGKMPKKFMGYPVHDANDYDMRYLDPLLILWDCTIRTGTDYVNGKFVEPTTKFVVKENDPRCDGKKINKVLK